MAYYRPSYTLGENMIEFISEISERVGFLKAQKNFLKKDDVIIKRTSSLLKDSLSEKEFKSVFSQENIKGNKEAIIRAKNLKESYEKVEKLDITQVFGIKKLNYLISKKLSDDAGEFRKERNRVFELFGETFITSPPEVVESILESILGWARESENTLHPLILSSVLHYETVMLNPFSSYNEELAIILQTEILRRWREVFDYINLEEEIMLDKEGYTKALLKSQSSGRMDLFIEFILKKTELSLCKIKTSTQKEPMSEYVKRLIDSMELGTAYTSRAIMNELGLKSKENFRKNYLDPAMRENLIKMTVPDKPNSRNQRYVRM